MSSPRRRRRCVICRRGFVPRPRVGDRQRACGRAECQGARRKRNQDEWRLGHLGYFIAWRARERAERAKADGAVDPPGVAAPLSRLPWQLAQEEFGVMGADFLGSLGRILVDHAKDEIRSYSAGSTGGSPQVAPVGAKDEIRGQEGGPTGESPQVGPLPAKDEIREVAG